MNPCNGFFSRTVRKLLSCRPPEGTGVRKWIFRVVCTLCKHKSDGEITAFLIAATRDCKKDRRREIEDAIRSVRGKQKRFGGSRRSVPSRPRWPQRNEEQIKTILRSGIRLAGLQASSPHLLDPKPITSLPQLLSHLFPGDPLLCIGWTTSHFDTMPLSRWCQSNFGGTPPQFIVPSPMRQLKGLTEKGKLSARSKDNTGPRRYLVVEFDFRPEKVPADAALLRFGNQFGLTTTRDLCACLLNELARFAPLALVVWSGGKSLQGWFPVDDASERTVEKFFAKSLTLGADPATWSPCNFVRFPGGIPALSIQPACGISLEDAADLVANATEHIHLLFIGAFGIVNDAG